MTKSLYLSRHWGLMTCRFLLEDRRPANTIASKPKNVRVPADSSCRFMRSFCLIAEASGPRAQSPEAVESIGEGSASSTHLTVQTVGAALFVCFRTESDSFASMARLGAYKIRLINATRFSVQGYQNMVAWLAARAWSIIRSAACSRYYTKRKNQRIYLFVS